MTKYTVHFERDESGWWVATSKVAPFKTAVTQGRTIGQARERIREAIGTLLDDEKVATAAKLVEEIRLPAAARKRLDKALALRAKAEAEQTKAASATAEAVRALVEKVGLSVRDAAELLGLSHQRVHQLVHGAR